MFDDVHGNNEVLLFWFCSVTVCIDFEEYYICEDKLTVRLVAECNMCKSEGYRFVDYPSDSYCTSLVMEMADNSAVQHTNERLSMAIKPTTMIEQEH